MEYIELQDMKMPVIGLGTWNLRRNECVQAVTTALKIGYRHIDTAQMYENESEIGEALVNVSVPREDIFLTTKVWSNHLHYNDVIQTLNQSLQKLQTDYVDLFLIHWPNPAISLTETLKAMAQLKTEGKVKFLGVSNFNTELLHQAQDISPVPIVNVQVEYHPFLSQKSLLEYCQQNGVALTAYCPLVRGREVNHPVFEQIGKKYKKTAPQVILRWLIQQKNVAVIPKAARREHQLANFDISDFHLSDEEMLTISRLEQGKRIVTI